jgi:SAM-dependent methyltransferase
VSDTAPLTPQIFDQGFADAANSPWLRAVFGEDLPEDIEPFSFITIDGLQMLIDELRLGPGRTLVDLACGRGGPGLWPAGQTEAKLIGVDFSPVGIDHARLRAATIAPDLDATYVLSDAADTGLPTGCADAVVCIDAIQLMSERESVARETARVLKVGGRVGFTTWEGSRGLDDLGAVLAAAPLRVVLCQERPDWLERERRILRRATQEAGTFDDAGLASLAEEAETELPTLDTKRRIIVVAERVPG